MLPNCAYKEILLCNYIVTITKKKKHQRKRSKPLKILEARGQKILEEKGHIINVGIDLYPVPSMPTESYHDVRYLSGVWSCNCAYYRTGHIQYKHICAIRATLLIRKETTRIVKMTYVEAPKIRCPATGSRISTNPPRMTLAGGMPQYTCATTPVVNTGSPGGPVSRKNGSVMIQSPTYSLMPP